MKHVATVCVAIVAVAVTVMPARTATAIEFEAGTSMVIEVGVREKFLRHYTYAGADQHGHRFEMNPPKRTMWLHAQTGDWVREKIHSGKDKEKGLHHNTIEGKGFLHGKPGERWSFSYKKKYLNEKMRRKVRCRAGAVEDGKYVIRCRDRRNDRPKAMIREITIDAETGMWTKRRSINEASRRVYLWAVVEMPTVTQAAPQVN